VDPESAGQYAQIGATKGGGDNLAKVVIQTQSNSGDGNTAKIWKFDETGRTTFPGNIIVPGNLSTIAGFAFYNGDPISIVATEPINSIRFIQPYHIEIAKTGLPAGFDTLLGSGTWTVTANATTFTVVSVDSNGDYWRITVAENPNGAIASIATFNRAASGANIVVPSTGSINFANGVNILSTVGNYGNTNVAAYLAGNVTVGNLLLTSGGEITTVAGTGNVVIEANDGVSRIWEFSSNAALIFPDSTVQTTAYVAANNVSRVTGSWTVTTGSANYDFTVPENGTYVMWVRGNIPNGIIAWNATATVMNDNVPVLGQQYAWNYDAVIPMPLEITALPVQFIGTANTIINANTYGGGPSNTFTFTVNNASGSSQTVYWGYVAQ
jgi:hypothetical protein